MKNSKDFYNGLKLFDKSYNRKRYASNMNNLKLNIKWLKFLFEKIIFLKLKEFYFTMNFKK
jgi:hypothetical protein